MYTLTLIAQKGGTGKTTLAINLSVASEAAGWLPASVDLDPQASGAGWRDHRGAARTDAFDFFHMDALSAAVPMKVEFDLQLTLMASAPYRLLGVRVGNGFEIAKARTLFRKLVHISASIEITASEIVVSLGRRANNPLLLAAGFADLRQMQIPVNLNACSEGK